MILLQMKAVISQGIPYWSRQSWVYSVTIIMVAYTFLFFHTKKLRKQAYTIFLWYPKERTDLKMIHDENNVPTDDNLVIIRGLLK